MVKRKCLQAFVIPAESATSTFVSDCLLFDRFPTLVNIELVFALLTAKDSSASRDWVVAEVPFALHRDTAARSAN